ncbi:MAG: hypothetical protein ACI9FR_001086 [Cryomorphaceae bacterium]|jgi:hypothetical protein
MAMGRVRSAQFTFWRFAEGRAVFEWQSFYLLRGLLKRLPKGDGHPVIVFPGFGGSDNSTAPMRGLLDELGYKTRGWGLGSNIVFDESLEAEMVSLVRHIYQEEQCKVSLVGWSLGGLFAREVAKACPEAVRCVVSLGSPISGDSDHSNAHKLFEAINGHMAESQKITFQELNTAPPVPTSSIYSRTDGIVAWEGSVQKDAVNTNTENIEVPASHLGIGVNPIAMIALADRLSQPDGQWQPFKRSGLKGLLFKQPKRKFSSPTESAFS